MNKLVFSLILAIFAAPFAASALPLPPANGINVLNFSPRFTANYDFEGIVALSNCSGSIIRFEHSKDTDRAMVLTNGHCYEGGFIDPGTFIINEPSQRTFAVKDPQGNSIGRISATKVLYGTMTQTDITLYELRETYTDILSRFKVRPLTLASTHPTIGMSMEVISGYWERGYSCKIESFINELHEGGWIWKDSIRYSRPGCEVIGGTSGSPIVLAGSRTVIGINNTGNEDGERCTVNNPCEVDTDGKITYHRGYSYGEQTYWIYSCLDNNGRVDMTVAGCMLPH